MPYGHRTVPRPKAKVRRAPASQGHPSQGAPTVSGGTKSKPRVYKSPTPPVSQQHKSATVGHPSRGAKTSQGAKEIRQVIRRVDRQERQIRRSKKDARERARRLNLILPEPAREISGMSRKRWERTMPKSDTRSGFQKALEGGASAVSKTVKKVSDKAFSVNMPTGHGPGTTRKMDVGPHKRLVNEATDLAVNLPTGTYIAADAVNQARKGNKKPLKELVKSFQDTSAFSTKSVGIGERLKRAEKRPLTTILEGSGIYGAVGRGARLGARTTKKGRRYTSQERPSVGHRAYERTGVAGPRTGRDYSKNLFTQMAQKHKDRKEAERAEQRLHQDAEDRPEGATHLEQRARQARERAPGSPSLKKRVDDRRFAQTRRQHGRVHNARQEARQSVQVAGRLPLRPKRRTAEREARGEVVRRVATGEARHDRPFKEQIQRALDDVNAKEEAARKQGRAHHKLNREEAANLENVLRLPEDKIAALVNEGKARAARGADERARGKATGTTHEGQQHHRWKGAVRAAERPTGRRDPTVGKQPKSKRALSKDITEEHRRIAEGDTPEDWVGPNNWEFSAEAIGKIRRQSGITLPVRLRKIGGTSNGYAVFRARDPKTGAPAHWEVGIHGSLKPAVAARKIRHELKHASDGERGTRGEIPERLIPRRPRTPSEYRTSPHEIRARWAEGETTPFDVERIPPPNAPIRSGSKKPPKVTIPDRPTHGRLAAKLKQRGKPNIDTATEVFATRRGAGNVPKSALRRSPMEQATRTLERRARRGKSTLPGVPERGPAQVSQRPHGVYSPKGLEPTHLPSGRLHGKAQEAYAARPTGLKGLEEHAAQTERLHVSAEDRYLNFQEFGIPAGDRGRVYAESRNAAQHVADELHAKTGEHYVPVQAFDETVTGARLAEAQRLADPTGTIAKGARSESGKGKWLVVPKEVADRWKQHADIDDLEAGTLKGPRAITGGFKDVVLTTVNPASWLTSNITDLTFRGLFGGHTPLDIYRGRQMTEWMRKGEFGPQGEQAFAALTGGGLYGAGEALVKGRGGPLTAPFRGYRDFIYKVEHGMERALQDAALGKAMRTHTDRVMGRNIKGLMKLQTEQLRPFAQKAATDRTFEAKLQRGIEDVIGRWGKVSPQMRYAMGIAPFAQWLGAATRYVYVTLPTKHPIKTGIMAGIMQMTEEERVKLGLSKFAPLGKQRQGYTMGLLPTQVGENKYGPTVSGIRTGHMLSFGTAGGMPTNLRRFVFPQVSGPLDALFGNSWQGDRLVYPPWWPNEKQRGLELSDADKTQVALGLFMETMIPFAQMARKNLMEKGEQSYPTSTILAPESRRKRTASGKYVLDEASKTTNLKDWIDPRSTGAAYTNEAIKAIRENEATFGPGGTLDRLKKQKKKGKVRPKSGSGVRSSPFGS